MCDPVVGARCGEREVVALRFEVFPISSGLVFGVCEVGFPLSRVTDMASRKKKRLPKRGPQTCPINQFSTCKTQRRPSPLHTGASQPRQQWLVKGALLLRAHRSDSLPQGATYHLL